MMFTSSDINAIERFLKDNADTAIEITGAEDLAGGLSRRTKLLKTNREDLVISFFTGKQKYTAAKIITAVRFLRGHSENVITHVTNGGEIKGLGQFEIYKYEPGYHVNILNEHQSTLLAHSLAGIHTAGFKYQLSPTDIVNVDSDLRWSITHGEIYSQNIVFNNTRLVLIDWEEIDIRPLISDIAEVIASFFILNPALAGDEFNMNNIVSFVSDYDVMLPLTGSEKKMLPYFISKELNERVTIAEKEGNYEAAARIRKLDPLNSIQF